MVEFHDFPTLMVPNVFSARRVSKILVNSSLIVQNFEYVWANLNRKIVSSSSIDGAQIANFINRLDREQKALLLLGDFASILIKQLTLSLPDFYPLLFLKFTA